MTAERGAHRYGTVTGHRVRPKTEPREVWQNLRLSTAPNWVNACIEQRVDGLYLNRRSGLQRIELGDWIIRNLDGEPEWLTNAEMMRSYEAAD